MVSFQRRKAGSVRRYPIVGGRRLSNYWWSLVLFLGGYGFLLTGISSYFNKNLWISPPGLMVFINKFQENVVNNKAAANFGTHFLTQNSMTQSLDYVIKSSVDSNFEFSIPFFPQGLVLSFYGFLGVSFSFHLWFTLYWKIGGGFNEFNEKDRYVRLFRWGRPGKNRRIDLKYTNELIEAIKVQLNPRPALFLRIKGDKNIPLTRLGDFIPLEELEAQAAEITSFMQIPLEMESELVTK